MPLRRAKKSSAADTYMQLIDRFPLRVRNESDHNIAVRLIGELMGSSLDAGQSDYLDNLITIVAKFEETHHLPNGELTPREMLQALMKQNNLSRSDVGKIIGSATVVSMFLNGDRELSKAHIRALANRFKVSASAFI